MLQLLTRKTLIVCTIITNILYLVWRIFFTIPENLTLISGFFVIGLILVELIGMFELFVHFYGMSSVYIPELPEIDEDLFPEVDIFIATYNEPVDLVQKTINGCIRMDYPDSKKVHIYVCDDGCRQEMKAVALKMGVGYIIREEHVHAKAGNLNNAMKYTQSPLIATFDADMIPMHHFLMSTVPYFLENEQARKDGREENFDKIGFIQTPQCFYNTDLFQFNLHSEDRIPNEQDYFYRDIQTAKNASNTVIYGGSNTLISRAALDEVGGFYTNSITEDFATGLLIQNKHYRCYALDKPLASGLSPDDLKSLIKQRERWGRGCIQTGRRIGLFSLTGLTFGQKLSYLSSITYWFSSMKRFFYVMAPIVFSVFGITVVECNIYEVMLLWFPMYFFTNATIKRISNNIRNTRWSNIYETIMFQALMFPILLETFGISQNKFLVTKKGKNNATEKSYQIKQSIPFIIYIVLSIIGIVRMLYLSVFQETAVYAVILFWLISNMLNLVMAAFFLMGRKKYRSTERFTASLPCEVKQGTLVVSCETIDISEDGFALRFERPEYIDPNKEFDIYIEMDAGKQIYRVEMKAKIAHVEQIEGAWKYAGYITNIEDEVKDEWYAIVHDRVPTLPQTIVRSRGFYDDLEVNIKMRLHKEEFLTRKTARINFREEFVSSNLGEIRVINFNYHYIILEFFLTALTPKEIDIYISDEITLHCRIHDLQYKSTEVLYNVENIEEIVSDRKKREKLMEYISHMLDHELQLELEKKQKEKKKAEIDLMNHI
ncbi:MAG: glycosyltransferase [Lachnospiraceae bacterium]